MVSLIICLATMTLVLRCSVLMTFGVLRQVPAEMYTGGNGVLSNTL